MSSISSVGGGTSLYSFLQSVTQSNQAQSTAASPSTAATSTTSADPTSSTSSTSSSPVQGHHHHHGKNSGGQDALFSQLQQTVSSALQSAQQDGTDPNQAIEDAISKIFQNNNSATSAAGSAGTDSEAAQANTPASLTGTSASAASATSSAQAFFQTLQSFGVDPQQFHQDFLAAAQGTQNGTADASTAFQSFPPGSLIDTTG